MPDSVGSGPAPGWYDDPGGSGRLRYWSGSGWGDELRDREIEVSGFDPSASTRQPVLPGSPASGVAAEPDAQILDVLRIQGGRTAAELAREANLSTSEVLHITDRLVEQGRIASHGLQNGFYLADDPFWSSVPTSADTASTGFDRGPSAAPGSGYPVPARPTAGGVKVDARSGLPLASFGQRVGAYMIDAALIFLAFIAVGIVILIAGAISEGFGLFVGVVAWLGLAIGSAALLIISDGGRLGQTPGKLFVGIKVVGAVPGPIGYGRGTVRYLGRILDSIVCGLPIGLLWPAFDAENRAWHDLIADTRVVVAPQQETSLQYWLANVRI